MLKRPSLLATAVRTAQRSICTPRCGLAARPLCMWSFLSSIASLVRSGSSDMGKRTVATVAVATANAGATAEDGDGTLVLPRAKRARSAAAALAAAQPAAVGAPVVANVAPEAGASSLGTPAKHAASTAPGTVHGSPAQGPEPAAADATPAKGKKKKASKPLAPSVAIEVDLAQLRPKAAKIAELLGRLYPQPPIPLTHDDPFQLLCCVLLSAQTTDVAVNKVTPALFQLAPDASSMAAAEVDEIASCIRTLGLAPTKAKNLKLMSQMLVELHGCQVPEDMAALEELPGVGHKTASVVMAQAFGHDAFPIDTHIHRLAQRWGLTPAGRSVEQTEADLKLLFPQHLWRDLHLQIIYFGREMCPAKAHDPSACPICSWAAVPPFDRPGASPAKANGKRPATGSAKPRKKAEAAKSAAPTAAAAATASAAVAAATSTAADAAPGAGPKLGKKRRAAEKAG